MCSFLVLLITIAAETGQGGDGGPVLGWCWGSVLGRCRAGVGPVLGLCWTGVRPVLGRCWSSVGPTGIELGLVRCCVGTGSDSQQMNWCTFG